MRPTNPNPPYQYPEYLRSCAGLFPHRSPTRRALPLAYYPIRSGNPHTRIQRRCPPVQSRASTTVIHLSSSMLFGIHMHLPMHRSFGFVPNPFVRVRLRQALSRSISHPLASPSPSTRPASVFTLAHAVRIRSRFETPCASLRAATRIGRQGSGESTAFALRLAGVHVVAKIEVRRPCHDLYIRLLVVSRSVLVRIINACLWNRCYVP